MYVMYIYIYALCLGIQQYLFENNRIDNIFTDFYYDRFTDCLNEILSTYQVSLNSQGSFVHVKHGFPLTPDTEDLPSVI